MTTKSLRLIVAFVFAFVMLGMSSHSRSAILLPEPGGKEADILKSDSQVIVFAGGCFWGVQAVFQHVNGVLDAVAGYAGGTASTASYSMVSTGKTGHAEAVRITYNPALVSLEQLMKVYFSVAHDPTELNRQGPDVGTQYRSEIFYLSEDQAKAVKSYIAQLEESKVLRKPIATKTEKLQAFYPAEAYHQNYAENHPGAMYIMINDAPKLTMLKKLFPDLYKEKISPTQVKMQ